MSTETVFGNLPEVDRRCEAVASILKDLRNSPIPANYKVHMAQRHNGNIQILRHSGKK